MVLYDRLVEYHQLFNLSLWDSERAKLFISSPNAGDIFLFMLSICLLAIVVLGFGLYIWFFMTSSEHSQVRVLNILNVYFSAVCIGGGVNAFIIILTAGLGYYNTTGMDRITALFILVAISATLLLISLATVLNHFRPEIYLDLSVAWRHSIVLPSMLLICGIVFALIFNYCSFSLDKKCMIITVRRFFLIPATCISFILQSIVIIDEIWGLKKTIKFLIPTNETPVIELQNPALGLQNHVVC